MPIVRGSSPPSHTHNNYREIVQVTGDTTLTENHRGRVLQVNSANAVTLTLPNDLAAGFHCKVERYGAGQVTFTAASGATLHNTASAATMLAQYSVADLFVSLNGSGIGAVYNLSGERSTGVLASVSWVVAAGAANICTFTGTLKDAAGATIAASRPIQLYISEAATGIGITADAYSTGASITTGTQLVALTANKAWLINTHTDGTFRISITDTAKPADQYAVAIIGPTGQLSVSAASAALWG